MPKAQVLAHPCSRAAVQTTVDKQHRTSTNAQTKMIKQTVRYTASAEQTVRRFFYGRGVGVSTLVNHMQSNSIDTTGIYAITYNNLLLH